MCVVMSSNGDGAMEKCTKVIELKLYLFIYLFYLIVCLKYTICTYHKLMVETGKSVQPNISPR